MLQRAIPSTGESLPVIGLGSWIQFDVPPSGPEKEPLSDLLNLMIGAGGGLIDSSPMYGNAERVIGDLTCSKEHKDRLFFATKVWTSGEGSGILQMESSLNKMRRSKMDLIQVHNLLDWQTHLKTLQKWKEAGKLRYIGITHYMSSAHARLEQILQTVPMDFVQFNYSIRDRNAEISLLNVAAEHGVAVIINEPFESGALLHALSGKALPGWAEDYHIRSWPQYLLKFIVSHPAVTCVIPGTSESAHFADNLQAGTGPMPDEKMRRKMVEYFEKL